jgi:hypothetical protein
MILVMAVLNGGKEEKETRLYITSSKENAEVTGKGVRSHRALKIICTGS